MSRRLFVTGTDTDVGKTVVAAALAGGLRRLGHTVAAVKPLASGEPPPGTDATLLGQLAGHPPKVLACFRFPAAPTRAMALEGRSVPFSAVASYLCEQEASLPADSGVLLVEGVGGWRVPLTPDATVDALARWLAGPVVVVAAIAVAIKKGATKKKGAAVVIAAAVLKTQKKLRQRLQPHLMGLMMRMRMAATVAVGVVAAVVAGAGMAKQK